MALNAIIGALRANLGMDSAEFKDGVKDANKSMDRMQRRFVGLAKQAATSLAAIGTAAAAMFTVTSKSIADLYAEAQTAGVAFEEFQRLKFAADQKQVSIDALTDGLKELNLRADEFVKTGGGSAAEAFARLGFSSDDLAKRLKNPSALFLEIVDRLEGLETAAQIRIADEIFGGTGGEQFVRLLGEGSEGLRRLGEQAEKLGVIVSEKTGRAARDFHASLSLVRSALAGVATRVTANMLPAMQLLADQFVSNENFGRALDGVVKLLTGAFNGLVRVVRLVIDNLGLLYNLFKILVAARIVFAITGMVGAFLQLAKAIKLTGLAMAAFASVQRIGIKGIIYAGGAIALVTGQFERLEQGLGTLFSKLDTLVPQGFKDSLTGLFSDIDVSADRAASNLESFLSAVNQSRSSFSNLSTLGSGVSGSLGAIAEKSTDAWAGIRKVTSAAVQAGTEFSSTLQNKFTSWIDSAIDGNFNLQNSLNDLGRTMAKLAASKFFGVLFGGTGGGGGGFLSSILGGAPSFATGGSFKVGGVGGIDSQYRMINASPNETVHVTKPGQMASGGGANLRVFFDGNGNLDGRIEQIAGPLAAEIVKQQAPGIIDGSISGAQQSRGSQPGRWKRRT